MIIMNHILLLIRTFDILYDSSSQSCDNSDDIINCNIPIYFEHTVVKDNIQNIFINNT